MQCIKIGNWLIKASSLDDQILICGYKEGTVETFSAMFYDENTAFTFMEKLYDQDCKTHHG